MIEGTLLNAPMNIGLKTRETRRLSEKKKKNLFGWPIDHSKIN